MSQNPENTENPESPENTDIPAGDAEEHAAPEGVAGDEGAETQATPEVDEFSIAYTEHMEQLSAEEQATPESLENDIATLESDLASTHDKLLRAVAETENVRRRAQRDKEDTARYAVTNFARDLIAVADNLRRALDSVDEATRKENPAMENLMIGVEMTERELMTAFERSNIRRMDPVGQGFDPNVHEAMFEYDDPEQPAGTVGQVIEAGYMIHDRTLRPAKVGITKGGPEAEPAPAGSTTESAAESTAGSPAESPAETTEETVDTSAYKGRMGGPGEHIDEEL